MFIMNINTLIYLYVNIISLVLTHPVDKTNPELTAGYFEGDMILSAEQKQFIAGNDVTRKARHALYSTNYRWPNRTVIYQLSKQFSKREFKLINQAMEHITSNTCIRFQHISSTIRSSAMSFLLIRPSSNGCSAGVGYQNRGVQYLNLVPIKPKGVGCFRFGTIVHELLHTLGIFHQQSASDRDQYVKIYEENITSGEEHNFRKLPEKYVTSFGVSYDYASVMHYGPYAFSWNGLPTIEPLNDEAVRIGQREGLSIGDIQKVRRMYKC